MEFTRLPARGKSSFDELYAEIREWLGHRKCPNQIMLFGKTFYERRQEAFAEKNNRKLIIYTCELSNEHGYRDIAETALLYKFKPLCPKDGKEGYHHGDVQISVGGNLKKTFGSFTLHSTDC